MKIGSNDLCPCGSKIKYKKCCRDDAAQSATPKVLLLFGAGASYGSGYVFPKRPPLGCELYGELESGFPTTWGQLKIECKEIHDLFLVTGNFEKGMAALRDKSAINYVHYWNDAAIYFSRFRIADGYINAYQRLIDRFNSHIQAKKILLSTLNYECLLECAIAKHNPQITFWGDGPGIKLLKVHGSCHFVPNINIQGSAGLQLQWPGTSKIPIKPHDIDTLEKEINTHSIKRGIPVAMHLYTADKDVIGGGAELEGVLHEFHASIETARLVIVIGVRPNPDDMHIWDHLKNMRGRLRIVGNKDDCEKWTSQHRPDDKDIWLSDRFLESLNLIFDDIDKALY